MEARAATDTVLVSGPTACRGAEPAGPSLHPAARREPPALPLVPMRLLLATALLIAAPAGAQHDHGAAPPDRTGLAEAFTVDGLRVGNTPPPGSGVGRAGLRFSDGGYVSVVHGQPFTRGRAVFGGLVGWDQVWSLGAHRSTELWTTVPLVVGGARLAPGGYSLFATPGEAAWTVHVNRRLGAHLADEYDAAENVVSVTVLPRLLAEPQEALRLSFETDDGLALRIAWDRTAVSVPFTRAD